MGAAERRAREHLSDRWSDASCEQELSAVVF
jgi:hypothetical protein